MTEEKNREDARNVLSQYLEGKHLRKTPERFAILDKVFGQLHLFSIDSLLQLMDDASYHVSRATLYNTMQLFVDAGLVRKHLFNGSTAKYERVLPDASNHYHLVCRKCGKVKEVKAPEILKELTKVKSRTFHGEYFSVYVYGICSTCQRKNKKTL